VNGEKPIGSIAPLGFLAEILIHIAVDAVYAFIVNMARLPLNIATGGFIAQSLAADFTMGFSFRMLFFLFHKAPDYSGAPNPSFVKCASSFRQVFNAYGNCTTRQAGFFNKKGPAE
jgi:hypothetical protein